MQYILGLDIGICSVGSDGNPYNSEPFKIWYGDGIIDIDCGCGNKTDLRRLACLRLEDMAEFYI